MPDLTTIDSQAKLELLREVRLKKREVLQVEEAVVADLMADLESGKLDDLRDAGEDRWVIADMTVTLGSTTTWTYSKQTVDLAQQLKEAQKAEKENGDARGVTKSHFVARFD
tara:strand:+ start:232 stop:567 length:336 start_codon:yes stop_codon:yes gene_type:complete